MGLSNVTMILDMKQQTFQFLINMEYHGIIFEHIEDQEGLEYRIVVTMRGVETSITMLEFKVGLR